MKLDHQQKILGTVKREFGSLQIIFKLSSQIPKCSAEKRVCRWHHHLKLCKGGAPAQCEFSRTGAKEQMNEWSF